MNGAGTASSPRLVSSAVFYGDEPSPRLLAHFLERTLGALDGVGKGRRCPGAAGGTSDVRRSGRTEKLQERLLLIPADFKRRRLPNIRNSARPALITTNPTAHKTKRSEC